MDWMDRERNIWVVGGDLRQRALARLLREDGHTVHIAALEGELPSPLAPPAGCRFHPRCPKAKDICRQEAPQWKEMGAGWRVRCWLA